LFICLIYEITSAKNNHISVMTVFKRLTVITSELQKDERSEYLFQWETSAPGWRQKRQAFLGLMKR